MLLTKVVCLWPIKGYTDENQHQPLVSVVLSTVNMAVPSLSLFFPNRYQSPYRISLNVPEVFVFLKNDYQMRCL